MAHEVKKKFLAEIAYTEREFQEAHTAFGNQANFDYELNDLNTRLFKVLSGNAIINGYFYNLEGDRIITLPITTGILYITLSLNKSTDEISITAEDKIRPNNGEFERSVVLFVVEMEMENIIKVTRTTQDDIFRYVQDLSEVVEHANDTKISIKADEDVDVVLKRYFDFENVRDKNFSLYIDSSAKNAPDANYEGLYKSWSGRIFFTGGGAKVVVYDGYGNMFTKSYTSNMNQNKGWMNSGEAWYQVFTGSRDLGANKTVTFNRVSFHARGVRVTMQHGQTFTRLYSVNAQGANMSFLGFLGEHYALRAYVNNANVQLQTGGKGGTVIKIEVLA